MLLCANAELHEKACDCLLVILNTQNVALIRVCANIYIQQKFHIIFKILHLLPWLLGAIWDYLLNLSIYLSINLMAGG